ncbi:hypothetical protein HPB48_010872 [Haemaphysalis longicornis]|uniref:Uncharacterized protein n=1 Tax=Haemaphysalis longicornis TaxID=44386 RepID=A0A9J6GHS7_HAELO|nr:hypothetical protein HPB48_010872 [Haemaphysalis longicornis]
MRKCNGHQLHDIIRFVLKHVESTGFEVVRFVTENHKVNVIAMQLFSMATGHIALTSRRSVEKALFALSDNATL